MKNATIEKVLQTIEEKSDYYFLYNNKLIDVDRKVSVRVKNAAISAVLEKLFKSENVEFEVKGSQIILSPKEMYSQITTVAEAVQQQKKTITGTVVDAAGEPIIGANIVETGTTNGTVTDMDGKFSLNVDNNATIHISYIGYLEHDINTSGRTNFNITLLEDTQALEEVVVVGYGTMKKRDLTGAISSVTSESLENKPVISAAEALAGQVAGLQIQQISGRPGAEGMSIRVRGTSSITQSNEPLYVVDGYPMEESAFRMISPSNIESIEVLKDASSTAIYGSRGANGVVIITTKKGAGKPSVSVNIYTGFQQPEKYFNLLDKEQYIEYFIDGRNQAWLDAGIIAGDPDKSPHTVNDSNSRRVLYPSAGNLYMIPDGKDGYLYDFMDPASVAQMPNTDWQRELFRTAPMQNYELMFSGSGEKTSYFFSANYAKHEGIIINSDYDRINLNSNIDSKINEKIKIGFNINSYFSRTNQQVEGKYSPVQIALQLPPIFPVRNEDGTYGSMVRNYDIIVGDVASPIGLAEQITDYRTRSGWLAILYADWEILNNLNYRISLNGGINSYSRNYFLPSYVDMDASRAPRMAEGINEKTTTKDLVFENTLTYHNLFSNKHDLTALVGYTVQQNQYDRLYGEARGFPNDVIKTLNAGTMYNLSGTESEHSMISYLSRINYVYDNKYLFSAAFRTDGSSRFGKDNKWGMFPSLSVGWRMSEEAFMKDFDTIDDLKLRASFGISGNNRIGNYSAIGLLNTSYYPTGDQLQYVVEPSTMPNDKLGWEKTQQLNLGFDFTVLNNRVVLTGDFYRSESLDLLLDLPVPTITGYSSQMQNIGKVLNKGMEYALTTRNLINEFKWTTNFNISFNKNEVLELGPDQRPIFASAPNASNAFITKIGYPIASFYGYVYEGVFMSQAEIDKYPHLSQDKVGDGRYKDVNEDGKLDGNDMTILGDNHPLFTGGLQNNFSYKNFNLSALFNFSYGAEVYSIYKRMIAVYHGDRNGMLDVLNRWRSPEEPGNGKIFRATRTPTGWSRSPSSYWLTDGSYLRIRNVTLSYDFENDLIKRFHIQALRLYFSGQNLYTFTNNPGYDPEASSEGDGLTKGGDYTGYPSARSLIFGLNFTF
ncbi:MAG: TonB-dependent receptor [Paludibacter sp.]